MDKLWEPHNPIHVEKSWNEFITSAGGQCISELISKTPDFENADYIFSQAGVIAELKEIETDFAKTSGVRKRIEKLWERVVIEDPTWRPLPLGGDGKWPDWYYKEYFSILKKPLARILEKANSQIRSTKKHFDLPQASGVLLFVNDGFISYSPNFIRGMISDVLTRSYSSIDCFIYLTVNRYVSVQESAMAHLIWAPVYSANADDTLVCFIDDLGKKWFNFLEKKIGPFDLRTETDEDILRGSNL